MLSFITNLFVPKPIIFELSYNLTTAVFQLRANKNDKPYPIKQGLSRFKQLQFPIAEPSMGEVMPIRPQDVEAVRAWLGHLSQVVDEKHVICRCDSFSEAVKQVKAPADFALSFSDQGEGVFCALPEGVTLLSEGGWFLSGNNLWHMEIGSAVSQSMRGPVVGDQLVGLLAKELPALINRGISVDCPFSYDETPYLWITVKEVTESKVSIQRDIQVEELRPVVGTSHYVWDKNTLRPKQNDELIERLFAKDDNAVLTGDEIPEVVSAARGAWKPFFQGEVQRLLELHPVCENGELLLYAYSEQHNGIGKACARAEVWSGKNRYSAAQLSRAILPERKFVRTSDGWFRLEFLEKLGLGRMGRLADGRSLGKPFELSAEELLSWGGERLSGPWKRLVVENLQRGQAEKSRAYSHLYFLAEWGLSGGLNGSGTEQVDALLKFLHEICDKAPQCRVLIIGKKQRLDEISVHLQAMSPLWLDGSKKDAAVPVQSGSILIATTNAVVKNEMLPSLRFDMLVLFEPDTMTKSNSTKIFTALNRLKAKIHLALYADLEYRKKFETYHVQQELLGIAGCSVADCLIINPNSPLPLLPKPYKFNSVALHTPQTFAEIQMQAEPVLHKSIPIPQRAEPSRTTSVESQPQSSLSIRTREQLFVEQAKELSTKMVKQAVFTPFMTYWPTYGSMNASQAKWYFYWRGKVRGSEYPQTDLSYIFLYVYELINLVGCRSPLEGYQKLIAIWQAYRVSFPKLDRYLADWVRDFALVHGLDVPVNEIFRLCGGALSGHDLDFLLLDKFREKPLNIDLSLLSQVAKYNITQSKFYQSAYASLCDEYVPKVVALVDAFMEKQQGCRIIEMFNPGSIRCERYLFQSALYAGDRRTVQINVMPLSTHPPLRDFLAQVIRYTENKLREIKSYHGKLRGIELEEDLGRLIDEYLERELIKKTEQTQASITLDVNKLARATAEAEQTQRMLMIDYEKEEKSIDVNDTGQEATETAAIETLSVRPHNASDGLLPDFAPMTELFTQLEESEFSIVNMLRQNNWEMETTTLQAALPGCMTEAVVDRINQKALQTLGGLLIVQENWLQLIDEDYRDELKYLEEHPVEKSPAHAQVHAQVHAHAHAGWNADGLNKEWLELCQKLSPCQLDLLQAIVQGVSSQELQQIAEQEESMLEAVLDNMNEAAMETIGDLLIQDGAVLEEYIDQVKTLFLVKDEKT